MDDYADNTSLYQLEDDDDQVSGSSYYDDDDAVDALSDFELPEEDLHGLHIVGDYGDEEPTPEKEKLSKVGKKRKDSDEDD